MAYPKLIETLIENLSKLPGVGRRSAERMAFWYLNHPIEDARAMAESVIALKEGLMFCRDCHNFSDKELCSVCTDPSRDRSILCVVEDPKDVIAIERSGSFRGLYHVLLGTISPSDGRGPEELTISQLLERINSNDIKEVVIATDADSDGEMTALYLIKTLSTKGIKVSRIGFGIPMGSCVEFSDISTLAISMSSRREVKEVAE